MAIEATLAKQMPVFPGTKGTIRYECSHKSTTDPLHQDLVLKKVELINNKIADIKEISIEIAWQILCPEDYPNSNEQKERTEVVALITELFRDKVLTEYQFKTILAALRSGW